MNYFSKLLFTSILAFSSTTLFAAYGEKLPLQQIMTPDDAQAIGVDRLTPEQKSALERWAATWTHQVLSQSPSYRPGQNLSLWVQSWPNYANPTNAQPSQDDLNNRQKSNQLVDKVRDNGQYIDLKDGSSWLISPFYRYLTQNWQKGQPIDITKSANDLHPWTLRNLATNQVAEANMSTPPSPTGEKPNEPPQYYAGSVQLDNVTLQGDAVVLHDGTAWKIAPTDIYKVRSWSPQDRIKVEASDNYLYTYKLTNLESGEVALANPKH